MMRLIVMCKAPVAGRVKTRLRPQYSAAEAATLHAAMARTVVVRARHLFADVLVAADDPAHPFFAELGVPVLWQGEGSLGERMAGLLQQAMAGGVDQVMFVGTDSPHMPETRLTAATDLLARHDVVLGPVEDGGYDLIAMNGNYPQLFDDIDWGTPEVLRQSLQRAESMGLATGLLDVSFDVDSADDLRRAKLAGWRPAD